MSLPVLYATLISGDGWKEDEIKKLLDSLEPNVKAIYVAYNGKRPSIPWQEWTKTPIYIERFKWEDDFSLARNQAIQMLPKEPNAWALWIDTDDILVAPEGVGAMFEMMDEYTRGIFLRYAY